ncbi:MAG TPA: EAL domain-containing protein [Candidatus Angelobacter sp.]|nr:EAL domain-containing protein [Candidatus Angelobacter sp.]
MEAERSVAVLADVRAGLLREELLAWYQPIVRLGRERVVGFEALVRWRRSDGRLLPPHEFLPIVERSAQVADLDLAVLAQAARALRSLPPDLFVSVNVSARTLTLVDYAGEIARVAREAGIDPVRLHVEVTETTLLSVSDVVDDAMRAVAATGATWYVDDFGTGYSSIAHLRDLPVSGLKLDLSFTAGIRRGDARSVSIAQGLVGMAQGLGLDTIAEGVETEQEGAVLAAQGWRHGQGWRYGRARPLEEWLAQERRPRAPGPRA